MNIRRDSDKASGRFIYAAGLDLGGFKAAAEHTGLSVEWFQV